MDDELIMPYIRVQYCTVRCTVYIVLTTDGIKSFILIAPLSFIVGFPISVSKN